MFRLISLLLGIWLCLPLQAADPTMPPWYRASTPVKSSVAPLRLEGIVRGEDRSFAVISGSVVEVGQQIRGYKLVSVGDNSARLRSKSGPLVLRLSKNVIVGGNDTPVIAPK